jgi:predicted dehydrogenase
MTTKRNRPVVLVIGLRNQGQAHVACFLQDRRVSVAVADTDSDQITKVKQQHRISDSRCFGGPDAVARALETLKPRLVAVSTPTDTHAPVCIAAAQAGADVLCEKPLAPSAAEAERLLRSVDATGHQLWCGYHLRYMHPSIQVLLTNRALGTISTVHLEWLRLEGRPLVTERGTYPGGPIISDLGSHLVDLALICLGRPRPAYAAGLTAQPDPTHPELFERYGGLLVFASRQQAFVNMTYAGPLATSERASIHLAGDRGQVHVPIMTSRDDNPLRFLPTFDGEPWGVSVDGAVLGRKTPPRNPMECFLRQAKDAVSAALGAEAPMLCTGRDGLKVAQIIDAFIESGLTLQPVSLV